MQGLPAVHQVVDVGGRSSVDWVIVVATVVSGLAGGAALLLNWRDRVVSRKPVVTVVMSSGSTLAVANSGGAYALNVQARLSSVVALAQQASPAQEHIVEESATVLVPLGDIPPGAEREITDLRYVLGRLLMQQIGSSAQFPGFSNASIRLAQYVTVEASFIAPGDNVKRFIAGKFTCRSSLFLDPVHRQAADAYPLSNLVVSRGSDWSDLF